MNQRTLLSTGLWAASLLTVRADERFFTYVYEADVLPAGKWEFEQWLTYRKGFPEGDRNFAQHLWDFREEIEYGVTDHFSSSFYLNFRNDRRVARRPGLEDKSEFDFEGISAELKCQLLNPNRSPVGLVLYVEPTYNGSRIELEEKVILSRNWGERWVTAFNVSGEQEWEEKAGQTQRESVLEFDWGAAYRLTPHWSLGVEARFHSVYAGVGLDDHLGTGWFVGPNLHYGSARWWATLTLLPQVAGHPGRGRLDLTEHQTFETRLIFGINF